MMSLGPRHVAKGVDQPGDRRPRAERVGNDQDQRHQTDCRRRQRGAQRRDETQRVAKIERVGLGGGLGDHGPSQGHRSGRRIALRLPKELHGAGQPVAELRETPLDASGQLDVGQGSGQSDDQVAVGGPRKHAQHGQRADQPDAPVLEPQQVVGQTQDQDRGDHRPDDPAHGVQRHQPPDTGPQDRDSPSQGMRHGFTRSNMTGCHPSAFIVHPSSFYTIPPNFRRTHSVVRRRRNNSSTGHVFHSGLGGSDSMGT